jgi:hypothetical protein
MRDPALSAGTVVSLDRGRGVPGADRMKRAPLAEFASAPRYLGCMGTKQLISAGFALLTLVCVSLPALGWALDLPAFIEPPAVVVQQVALFQP